MKAVAVCAVMAVPVADLLIPRPTIPTPPGAMRAARIGRPAMHMPILVRAALLEGGAELERWAFGLDGARETLIDGLERKGYDVRGKTDSGLCRVVRRPPTARSIE